MSQIYDFVFLVVAVCWVSIRAYEVKIASKQKKVSKEITVEESKPKLQAKPTRQEVLKFLRNQPMCLYFFSGNKLDYKKLKWEFLLNFDVETNAYNVFYTWTKSIQQHEHHRNLKNQK